MCLRYIVASTGEIGFTIRQCSTNVMVNGTFTYVNIHSKV